MSAGFAAAGPDFWWRTDGGGWPRHLLSPAAFLYGTAAAWRLDHGRRERIGVPVLCVGNFTLGGAGKTPTALALGAAAKGMGLFPGFLSRGYGGALTGPCLVDPDRHGAADVGDEPLLLARCAPTVIAADRAAGAACLVAEAGVDLLIMDDGFQSAHLAIDFALVVVDAARGVGNGAVFPAGPLRAPLGVQMRHADALLVIGEGTAADAAPALHRDGGPPVHRARLRAVAAQSWRGERVLAFCGIADPAKFHATLHSVGATIVAARDFPDHHPYRRQDIEALREAARREGLRLVTTRKDAVRIASLVGGAGSAGFERPAPDIAVLDVALGFDGDGPAQSLIHAARENFSRALPAPPASG